MNSVVKSEAEEKAKAEALQRMEDLKNAAPKDEKAGAHADNQNNAGVSIIDTKS